MKHRFTESTTGQERQQVSGADLALTRRRQYGVVAFDRDDETELVELTVTNGAPMNGQRLEIIPVTVLLGAIFRRLGLYR